MKTTTKTFIGIFLATCLATSATAVDLRISALSFKSAVKEDGQQLIVKFKIWNEGNDSFSGTTRIKSFLFPSNHEANHRKQQKGVVLGWQDVELNLGSEAIEKELSFTMPLVPANIYHLGAFINSNRTIEESNIDNNLTTDLLNVQWKDNPVSGPADRDSDCYSDTNEVTPTRSEDSGVLHHWRLFCRNGGQNTGLFAYFMIYDLNNHKLYPSNYEKGVGWVHMGDDFDALGRNVGYDVYWQAPSYSRLPPGEYYLATLINSRDLHPEPDQSNNLDLRKFNTALLRYSSAEQGWYVGIKGSLNERRTLTFVSDFNEELKIEIDTSSLPNCINWGETTGQTVNGEFSVGLEISCTNSFRGSLPVKISRGRVRDTLQFPFAIFVSSRGNPDDLQVTEQVTVSALKPKVSETAQLTVKNNGQTSIALRVWSGSDWLLLNPSDERVQMLPPGGQTTLSFAADSQQLPAFDTHKGTILIQSSLHELPLEVPVNFTVQTVGKKKQN